MLEKDVTLVEAKVPLPVEGVCLDNDMKPAAH